MAESSTSIEYQQILISDSNVAELNSRRMVVLSVPRKDIETIELVKTFESKHPLIQIVFGVAILTVGLLPVPHIIDWVRHGGTLVDVEVLLLLLVAFGGVVIYTAVSRRPLLLIRTRRGRVHKLAFHGKASFEELRAFVDTANSRYNLGIVSRLPDVSSG
ncbi:MAG: hypothetical protein KDA62_13465 [Planctomycetales bacterium]|nr:hypothetical protein [Planctomycetales bacterium]